MREFNITFKMHQQFLAFVPGVAVWGMLLTLHALGQSGDASSTSSKPLPSVQDMIEGRTDVWGEAAIRQPNGPTYEFFKDLLPPVRWTNTEFRHYPIVLSAPRSAHKARLVSNGSGVNLRANKPPMWYEPGVPVRFFVGGTAEPFGDDLSALKEPHYRDGYLPVVRIEYEHEGVHYRQETFAPTDRKLRDHGAVMLRFSIVDREGEHSSAIGRVEARIDLPNPLKIDGGEVIDDKRRSIVAFGNGWQWDRDRNSISVELANDDSAELIVFTKPAAPGVGHFVRDGDALLRQCLNDWRQLLKQRTQLEVPEKIIDEAWRALLIANFMIAVGDKPNYSAQNAYAKLYEGECGDTLRSLLCFGHVELASAMLRPMLEFDRFDTRFHVAGHKLQLLAYYYWMTRDGKTVRAYESLWRPSVDLILDSREKDSGLLPKDRYAGDIAEKVYSLNSNANCWRGLRDLAAVLHDIGDDAQANKLRGVATQYREAIIKAVARSERLETEPPFIPNALLADELAHDPLTATRTGSYYDLMCPYIIGSEVFGQATEREDWLLAYLQKHGGIAMGMPRTRPSQGQFKGEHGVVPLYGLRYQLALLRRDEREKALVGFYGHLAQGMTRNTYVGGEGTRFLHGDEHGRSFYLPPNSASNAVWLLNLRYLIVQDWDLDEDAEPETLRLLFGIPRHWLADGQRVSIHSVPTMFGPVSCEATSKLSDGFVEVRVQPPPRPVKDLLLRAPLPDGWKTQSAEVDGELIDFVSPSTVQITERKKPVTVRFRVIRM